MFRRKKKKNDETQKGEERAKESEKSVHKQYAKVVRSDERARKVEEIVGEP